EADVTASHHDAEFFSHQFGLAFAADAGGVHEVVDSALAVDERVYGVARGARRGRNDGALGAGQAVGKRGLAGVWLADDGHLNGRGGRVALRRHGEADSNKVEQVVNSFVVLGGNRHDAL